mmetsp:Transcript_4621/g.6767  ORF Transcript_4621/g.6767 Transcript_4621/m.6767 type:complete len:225 (+) Transcript_4621:444-1118(+)
MSCIGHHPGDEWSQGSFLVNVNVNVTISIIILLVKWWVIGNSRRSKLSPHIIITTDSKLSQKSRNDSIQSGTIVISHTDQLQESRCTMGRPPGNDPYFQRLIRLRGSKDGGGTFDDNFRLPSQQYSHEAIMFRCDDVMREAAKIVGEIMAWVGVHIGFTAVGGDGNHECTAFFHGAAAISSKVNVDRNGELVAQFQRYVFRDLCISIFYIFICVNSKECRARYQ